MSRGWVLLAVVLLASILWPWLLIFGGFMLVVLIVGTMTGGRRK